MRKTTKMISTKNLNEWFKDRILEETHSSSPAFSEETISYVVNLLVFYSRSQHFFEETQNGLSLPTLAFLYREAYEAKTPSKKLISLRRLGDASLFIGALFPEKLKKPK